MSKYKISIIIPVYNVEKYIEKAFNSLLGQTIGFDNLQVIFADDCSNDNSGKIIDEYAKKNNNVIAIHLEENSHAAGKPRNSAMKVATAEYLMFLDPDDYYAEDACEVLYNKITETNVDIVSGYFATTDMDLNIIEAKTHYFKDKSDFFIKFPDMYGDAFEMRSTFCCKIYKNEIVKRNNILFPVGIPGQDTVFICHYLLCCKSMYYIDRLIYYYRLRENQDHSISNNLKPSFFEGINECYKQTYSVFVKYSSLEYYRLVVKDVLPFYIQKIIDSKNLCSEDILKILKEWQWLYKYANENQINSNDLLTELVSQAVTISNFKQGLDIINVLKPIRQYLLEVLNGKEWMELRLINQDKVIEELKEWASQLQGGKDYLEKEVKNRDKIIEELKEWANQLQGGKDYLEKEVERKDKIIEEQERAIDKLGIENRRLLFLYNEEKNKQWYRKFSEQIRGNNK